jgi:hypothetical protein
LSDNASPVDTETKAIIATVIKCAVPIAGAFAAGYCGEVLAATRSDMRREGPKEISRPMHDDRHAFGHRRDRRICAGAVS